MKELLRLAGWGTAATVALVLAVATAYSPGGQQRLFASNSGKGNVQNAPSGQSGARLAHRSASADAGRKT